MVEGEDGTLETEFDHVGIAQEYRRLQLKTRTTNDIFSVFLAYWPCLDYVIAAVMIFASIRFFTHLPFLIWLLHPACASRCFVEIFILMMGAAEMNSESERYMHKIGEYERGVAKEPGARWIATYLRELRKSYAKLTCEAGSLYTFEKTIVLVALHICLQVVFSLLVVFPTKG
jgi:hypothetical protein